MLAAQYASLLSQRLAYAAFAIALVAGILLLSLPVARWFRRRVKTQEEGNAPHLSIAKSIALGKWRRLMVIRRGDTEHVVITGGPTDVVIETILDHNGRETWQSDRRQEFVPNEAPARPIRAYLELARRLIGAEGLLPLALLSGASGAGAGAICGLFRLALEKADQFRSSIPSWLHDEPLLGCGFMIAFSSFLMRRYRVHAYAAGSGIPQVEAAIGGDLPPAPFALLPVKFFGGLLAIGAGLALGREGPCVQMGATISHLTGRAFRRSAEDCRVLLAAGAGAGLAAAFNAPLAGSAFVLEELLRKFEPRNAIAALGASGSAIVVARLFTGPAPDFTPFPIRRSTIISYASCWVSPPACLAPFTTATTARCLARSP